MVIGVSAIRVRAGCLQLDQRLPGKGDGGSPAECEDVSGTWDMEGCGRVGQCTIAQQGCALSVICTAFLLDQARPAT